MTSQITWKTEYKPESQPHVTCLQCGKPRHIARFCYSKDKGKNEGGHWCNRCHNSSHSDKTCLLKGKNKTDKVKKASGTSGDHDEEVEHSFVFETNAHASERTTGKANALLVVFGATAHIINNESKFNRVNDNFTPYKHYIELADGTRSNNVALN